MKNSKRVTAAFLAAFVGVGAFLPVAEAEASPIYPLQFPTYVNGTSVNLQNSIIYEGYTYVKLRDIGAATNMTIDFLSQNEMGGPGGGRLAGIQIEQPSFIYTKKNVVDYSGEHPVTYAQCVDITEVYGKYNIAKGKKFQYTFDGEALIVPDGAAKKTIAFKGFNYQGRMYVPVDEYRDKIQPYMVDICMQ